MPPRSIPLEPLTSASFSPFGTVIETPKPLPTTAVAANRGTATKIPHITSLKDFYHSLSSSGAFAEPVASLFICYPQKPRLELSSSSSSSSSSSASQPQSEQSPHYVLDVKVLERHPFTSQTFVPLGLSPTESDRIAFVVIVAPTLSTSTNNANSMEGNSKQQAQAKSWSREFCIGAGESQEHTPKTEPLLPPMFPPKGVGAPNLRGLRAFFAKGNQAVTYGPGTWHSPMVVIGDKDVVFVVFQFANGVVEEDCQEVEIDMLLAGGEEGVTVQIKGVQEFEQAHDENPLDSKSKL